MAAKLVRFFPTTFVLKTRALTHVHANRDGKSVHLWPSPAAAVKRRIGTSTVACQKQKDTTRTMRWGGRNAPGFHSPRRPAHTPAVDRRKRLDIKGCAQGPVCPGITNSFPPPASGQRTDERDGSSNTALLQHSAADSNTLIPVRSCR